VSNFLRAFDRDGNPISDEEAARLFRDFDERRVAYNQFDDVEVSTVHIVFNHRFSDGPPLIFETMIFGGEYDQHQWRYSTLDDALEGHQRVCVLLQEGRCL